MRRKNTSNKSACTRNDCLWQATKCACTQGAKTSKISSAFLFAPQSPRTRKCGFDHLAHRAKIIACKPFVRHDDVHILIVDAVNYFANRLAKQSFDSVSRHGVAHLFGDGQADFQSLSGSGVQKQKVALLSSFTLFINVGKRRRLFQPKLLLHEKLCGNALASSETTTSKHVSAGL